MTTSNISRLPSRDDAEKILSGIKQTGRQTLVQSAPALLDVAVRQLEAKLTNLKTENVRDLSNLEHEILAHRLSIEEGMAAALKLALEQAKPKMHSDDYDDSKLEILDMELVEAQLERTRTAHVISQALEWELADLNTRISFLHGINGVDESLNPISPEVLARVMHQWVDDSPVSSTLRPLFRQAVIGEFAALTTALYHELNAWLIREGVLPKIDLRAMVLRTSEGARWQQLTAQSLLDWQQPGLNQAVDSQLGAPPSQQHSRIGVPSTQQPRSIPNFSTPAGFANTAAQRTPMLNPFITSQGYQSAGLVSISPLSQVSPAAQIEALSRLGVEVDQGLGLWSKLKQKLSDRLVSGSQTREGNDSRRVARGRAGGGDLNQVVTQFDETIMQLLDHVETQLLSTLPNGDRRTLTAKAAASLPKLVQFREEMQAAASSANERATVELVALMFEHILTDESIVPLARILFARLQIPVLRVAIRENEAFMEATHPARDFIDRLASVVSGYSGEERIDDRLQAEIRRLVMAAEKSPSITGQFFSRLLYDFELFLERYGRELREVSVLGVPILEQTEDFKVSAVLYTIELRKLTDDVPCDKRVRDFLLHSWVSVMSSISAKYGKDSPQVTAGLRLAADLVWCAVPKGSVAERTELVSELPDLMRRVELALADAGASQEAQKKASTRLRSMLLQIIRAPAHQAPGVVFDTLLAKLQQFEQSAIEANERSPNYRIPLATLRSQIASRALLLQVVEPTDLKLDATAVASNAARQWAQSLKLGSWYRVELAAGRAQLLQLAWQSAHRNYLLFAESQGTAGMITEPNTVALLVERGMFKPVERATATARATKSVMQAKEVAY